MGTEIEKDHEPENLEAEEELLLDSFYDFANAENELPRERRSECLRCRRPSSVCWCPFLPNPRVKISTSVYILQHPFEELRKLKTAPMLYQSLEEGSCHIIRGKKFNYNKRHINYPDLSDILEAPNTVLLFPGDDSVDISELSPLDGPYNLVAIDGTWTQANSMYINNKLLHAPRKVMINHDCRSKYVIRTQPTDSSLSTLESIAVALSVLEQKPALLNILTAPLQALCEFQLHYGAVQHQSKEYKISHGLWTKRLPRKMLRDMEKDKQQQQQNKDGEGS